MYENFNLTDIVTPVKPVILRKLLEETGYDKDELSSYTLALNKDLTLGMKGQKRGLIHHKIFRLQWDLRLKCGTKSWQKSKKVVMLVLLRRFPLTIIYSHQLAWYPKLETRLI